MEKFNEIVSKIFNLKTENIKDKMSSKDIPDWDSMNYLLFIANLEKEFNVSFTMDEVLNAKSLGEIRTLIQSKIKYESR